MNIGLTVAKNEAAADFLKGKPVVSRQVFDRLVPELKARAFTITGLEGAANVMQAVRDRIAELPAGASWDEVKQDVAADISPYLVDPDAAPEDRDRQAAAAIRRAELMMRIHGFQSYMAAQHEVLERQQDVFPFWQYVTLGDERVRDSHAALNGLVLRADSPFWKDHYPPWEWGCRCDVIPLMDEDVAEIRQADTKRNPEDRLVLEGEQLRKLEQDGQLTRGPLVVYEPNDPTRTQVMKRLPAATHWVVSPAAEGKEGAFRWDPGDLKLTADELSKRYDPEVWSAWRKWAEQTPIGGGLSVMDWVSGKTIGAAEDGGLFGGAFGLGKSRPRLSRQQKGAYRIAEELAEKPVEVFSVVGADGKEKFARHVSGKTGGAVPKERHGKMAGATFVHNHPSGLAYGGYGRSFSINDIIMAADERVGAIVAASQRRTYTLAPGPKGWPTAVDLSASEYVQEARVKAKLGRMVEEGRVPAWKATQLHHHLIVREMARELGMVYTVSRRP